MSKYLLRRKVAEGIAQSKLKSGFAWAVQETVLGHWM